jgi:dihydrofolate synthase/folylpolyglutamate synthase
MNYAETLQYLFTSLPMYSRIGAAAYKEDLTNTIALCDALGNPHKKFRSIHIAGTNGKGSVSHMLAAIFQTAGYKTGLYTSPHLKDFRERIKVNGEMCSEEFVVDFVERIEPEIKKISPSFFEITVAMAFEYFVQQEVDIAIIEVGLGGRLDSTNIITPELSVITNIGLDHMYLLGDTIEKIAREKAGIIKENVPVVIGETLPETKNIFSEIAESKHAPIAFAAEHFFVNGMKWQQHHLAVKIHDSRHDEEQEYILDLPGVYQAKNIVTVLQAVTLLQLKGWNINRNHALEALKQTKKINGLHGRWEIISEHPTVVLDVAHNEDGIKQLVSQLEHVTFQHLHIIFGAANDKDINAVLSLLPKTATYYFTRANIPRAMTAETLQAAAIDHQLKGNIYPDVNAALSTAKQHASTDDLILVCGSIFLVAEVNVEF